MLGLVIWHFGGIQPVVYYFSTSLVCFAWILLEHLINLGGVFDYHNELSFGQVYKVFQLNSDFFFVGEWTIKYNWKSDNTEDAITDMPKKLRSNL